MTHFPQLTTDAPRYSFNKRTLEAHEKPIEALSFDSVIHYNKHVSFIDIKRIYHFSDHLRALKTSMVEYQAKLPHTNAKLQQVIKKVAELDSGINVFHPKISIPNHSPTQIIKTIFTDELAHFFEQMKETRDIVNKANEEIFHESCRRILTRIKWLNDENHASFNWMTNFITEQLEAVSYVVEQKGLSEQPEEKKIKCATADLLPEQILEDLAAPSTESTFQMPTADQNKVCPLLALSPAPTVLALPKCTYPEAYVDQSL